MQQVLQVGGVAQLVIPLVELRFQRPVDADAEDCDGRCRGCGDKRADIKAGLAELTAAGSRVWTFLDCV